MVSEKNWAFLYPMSSGQRRASNSKPASQTRSSSARGRASSSPSIATFCYVCFTKALPNSRHNVPPAWKISSGDTAPEKTIVQLLGA